MKFNKKLLSLLFVALLAIVLVGCNGEDPTTTEAPGTEAPTTQAPTTETPTTMPVDFQTAIDHLETEYADTLLNDDFEATEDLTLVNSFGEFTFTWSSNDTDLLANDGTISRPLMSEGNQTAVLTVTISHGEETATQDFFVTVKALEEKTPAEIADEVFLFVFAIPSQDAWTSADTLNLVDTGEDTDGTEYPVTWETSHPDYITTEGVITQPEGDDVDVTLTATITVDATEFTQERVFTVAKMAEATEVATIAEAIALGQDAYVMIPGVTVIAMYGGGDVFFTDGTDILYIYSPPFDAVVGEVYDITGSIDFYFNSPQLAGSDTHPLRIADSTEAVSSAPVVTVAGIEDIIAATSVPTSEAPHEYTSYEVTASVYYEESWGNYSVFLVPTDYDFDAALATGATQPNGDAIMIYYKSDMDVLESFHGEEITIEIIMQGYRTDKTVFYANFFGSAEDVQLSFSNDADAVAAAIGTVGFPYSVVEDATLDLTTSIYGVSIAYTTDNATVFDTTTGAVDVSTLTAQTTITVTATATKGTETATETFTIKVGPLPTSDISTVLDFEDSDLAMIEGTIVAGGYHGLFFIQDGTDNIALYLDAYGDDYDTMMSTLEANVGNVMKVTGEKDTYNGLHQLRVSEFEYVSDSTAPTATNIDTLTLDEAGLLAHQGELVELTGMVITDVYVDNYGNYQFTLERISDGEEIKLRWDSRYDLPTALMTEVESLAVGDKVTVTAVLSWFRGPQLALVTTTDFTVTTLTDADKVALDVRHMDAELTISDDYVIVDGEFGSTISVIEIFGNAANFMDVTTTAGTWSVTQPYDTDVMAIVTFKVMSGTVEEMVDVEVTISSMLMPQTPSELFISEYVEGSSNNKYIEIYNGTDADVDLSTYSVELYSNGATVVTQTLDLTGTLTAGDVYVIATDQAVQVIQDDADLSLGYPSVVHYNGDDAVVLRNDGTLIDIILSIGHPADDKVAAEVTWVRNSSTFAPNDTFTLSEWDEYEQDTFDYIGTHTLVTGETTDAMIVNADLAAIDLGGVVKTAQTITLPTTGDNGSTIAWTIAEDLDSNATMNATNDELTLTEVAPGTVEVVELEATVTMNAETLTGTFVYKIQGLTDAEIVAADTEEVEALDLGGEVYAEVSETLLATGTNGSTITWAITTDADTLASIAGSDLTIARADGTDSVVVLTATITKGTESDTVVFTYNMKAEITDLSMLHEVDSEDANVIADDTVLYVQGVVSALIYESFFIQDANGNGIYIDSDLVVAVGDEVLVKATLVSDGGVRMMESAEITTAISSGIALVYNEMTADEIVALDASDAGKLIKYTGLVVKEFSSSWPYTASFDVVGTTETITLSMDYFGSSNVGWMEDVYAVDDVVGEATFVFFDFAYGKTRIDDLYVEMTDAQAVQLDVADMPDTLELTEDMDIPTSEYGSTYTVTGITGDAAAFIDYTTTPGTLVVTQPAIGEIDATGIMTVEVSKGTETETVTVDLTVLAEVDTSSGTTYTQDFSFVDSSSSSYSESIQYTDSNSFTWDLLGRPGGATGFGLGNSSDGSFIEVTAQGGISSFTIDIVRMFTNENTRSVELFVNGTSYGTFTVSETSDTAQTWLVENIDVAGEVVIKLVSTSPGSRGAMDVHKFEWTTYVNEVTETFSTFVGSGTSYVTETFTGDSGFEWTVTNSRKSLGGYEIEGGGIMFKNGTMTSTITDGIGSLSLDILMAFTGGTPADRTIEIYVDGILVGSHTLSTTAVETLTINDINVSGTFVLVIENAGGDRQITINNLIWTPYTAE